MPITRLQFEMGIDDGIEALMVAVYGFLEEHQDMAYAEEELYQRFGAATPGSYIDSSHLDIALQKVVETGAVETRSVAHTTYYTFRQQIDKATWKPVQDATDGEGDEDVAQQEAPTDEPSQ